MGNRQTRVICSRSMKVASPRRIQALDLGPQFSPAQAMESNNEAKYSSQPPAIPGRHGVSRRSDRSGCHNHDGNRGGSGHHGPGAAAGRSCVAAARADRAGHPAFHAQARAGDDRRPQDYRIHHDHRGKVAGDRRRRDDLSGDDLQRFGARAPDGGASGRLCGADAGQSCDQHHAAQYRFSRRDRRARGRCVYADQPG